MAFSLRWLLATSYNAQQVVRWGAQLGETVEERERATVQAAKNNDKNDFYQERLNVVAKVAPDALYESFDRYDANFAAVGFGPKREIGFLVAMVAPLALAAALTAATASACTFYHKWLTPSDALVARRVQAEEERLGRKLQPYEIGEQRRRLAPGELAWYWHAVALASIGLTGAATVAAGRYFNKGDGFDKRKEFISKLNE
ncbi:MAG: hypothetical protein IJO40_14720 [Thermoguttaceae bacterium]|nr:hypothetical protein [Thermoguttaceae bacterium]